MTCPATCGWISSNASALIFDWLPGIDPPPVWHMTVSPAALAAWTTGAYANASANAPNPALAMRTSLRVERVEVLSGEIRLEDNRAAVDGHATGVEVLERTTGRDRKRHHADAVGGPAGHVHLAG